MRRTGHGGGLIVFHRLARDYTAPTDLHSIFQEWFRDRGFAANGTSARGAVESAAVTGGYPIVLDLRDRLVVIVGGGAVAVRKAQGLLASGAGRIRVVAPACHPDLPPQVQRVQDVYRTEHLAGALIVFAATDSPGVNDAVVQDARRIGALVCRADVDEDNAGDFATPAMMRDGPLLITISSGGSPALSALNSDRLAAAMDPRWSQMAQAMQSLRPLIRAKLPPPRRAEAFRLLCSDAAMDELAREGIEGFTAWLRGKYPELDE